MKLSVVDEAAVTYGLHASVRFTESEMRGRANLVAELETSIRQLPGEAFAERRATLEAERDALNAEIKALKSTIPSNWKRITKPLAHWSRRNAMRGSNTSAP